MYEVWQGHSFYCCFLLPWWCSTDRFENTSAVLQLFCCNKANCYAAAITRGTAVYLLQQRTKRLV